MSTQASSTACCILHRLSHHTHISSAFSSPQPQPPAPPHTSSPHAYLPPLVPRPLHGPPPSPSPLHSVRPCLRRVRWCLRVRVRVSKRPSIRMCSYCICVCICECARAPVPVCADRVYLFPPVQPARIFLPKPRSALRAPAKPSSSAHAAIPAAPCLAVSGCLAGVRQSAAGHPSALAGRVARVARLCRPCWTASPPPAVSSVPPHSRGIAAPAGAIGCGAACHCWSPESVSSSACFGRDCSESVSAGTVPSPCRPGLFRVRVADETARAARTSDGLAGSVSTVRPSPYQAGPTVADKPG